MDEPTTDITPPEAGGEVGGGVGLVPEAARAFIRAPAFQAINDPSLQVSLFKRFLGEQQPAFRQLNPFQQDDVALQGIALHSPSLLERGLTLAKGAAEYVPVVGEAIRGYEEPEVRPLTAALFGQPATAGGRALAEGVRGALEFGALSLAASPLAGVGRSIAGKVGTGLAADLAAKAFTSGASQVAEQYAGQAAGSALTQRIIEHGVTGIGLGELIGLTNATERAMAGGQQAPLEDFVGTPLGAAALGLGFLGFEGFVRRFGTNTARATLNALAQTDPARFAGIEKDGGAIVDALHRSARGTLTREQAADLAYQATQGPLSRDAAQFVKGAFEARPELFSTETGMHILRMQRDSLTRPLVATVGDMAPDALRLTFVPLVDDPARGFQKGRSTTMEVAIGSRDASMVARAIQRGEVIPESLTGGTEALGQFGGEATFGSAVTPAVRESLAVERETRKAGFVTAGGGRLRGAPPVGLTAEPGVQKFWSEMDERIRTPAYQDYITTLLKQGYERGLPAAPPELQGSLTLDRALHLMRGDMLRIDSGRAPLSMPEVLPYRGVLGEPTGAPFERGVAGGLEGPPLPAEGLDPRFGADLNWLSAQRSVYGDLEDMGRALLPPGEMERILANQVRMGPRELGAMHERTLKAYRAGGPETRTLGDDEKAYLALADRLGLTPQQVNSWIAEKLGYVVDDQGQVREPGDTAVVSGEAVRQVRAALPQKLSTRIVDLVPQGPPEAPAGPPLPRQLRARQAAASRSAPPRPTPPVGTKVFAKGRATTVAGTVVEGADPVFRVVLQMDDGSFVRARLNSDGTVDLPPAFARRVVSVVGPEPAAPPRVTGPPDPRALARGLEVGQTVLINPTFVEPKASRSLPALSYEVVKVGARLEDGTPKQVHLRPRGYPGDPALVLPTGTIVDAIYGGDAQLGAHPLPTTGTMDQYLASSARALKDAEEAGLDKAMRLRDIEAPETRLPIYRAMLNDATIRARLESLDADLWNGETAKARSRPAETVADELQAAEDKVAETRSPSRGVRGCPPGATIGPSGVPWEAVPIGPAPPRNVAPGPATEVPPLVAGPGRPAPPPPTRPSVAGAEYLGRPATVPQVGGRPPPPPAPPHQQMNQAIVDVLNAKRRRR